MMSERGCESHSIAARAAAWILAASSAACMAPAPAPKAEAPAAPVKVEPKPPVVAELPAKSALSPHAIFRPAAWSDLPGWRADNVAEAWGAFLASCTVLASREHWREPCAAGSGTRVTNAEAARRFFERYFTPYHVASSDSGDEGLITGYYEPLLRGSRKPTDRYRFPVHAVPDDLIVVELAEVYPELKGMRLRGRLDGRRLVPYPDRARIATGEAQLRGKEIVWVDDPIDLFFLHVQGSGQVLLDTGQTIRVGYADQNGHPYRSIGRLLVERGELTLETVSMQSIKTWARANPDKIDELLNSNASYVFFRELAATAGGPSGALGVPLTARRSIAVDPRHVPLGAPVFIETTWPNSPRALNRLTLAQDTGGAIRGPVRADLFWGHGEAAGPEAGRMKQRLRMWVLLPRGHPLPAAN